jgi:hypothetical protein
VSVYASLCTQSTTKRSIRRFAVAADSQHIQNANMIIIILFIPGQARRICVCYCWQRECVSPCCVLYVFVPSNNNDVHTQPTIVHAKAKQPLDSTDQSILVVYLASSGGGIHYKLNRVAPPRMSRLINFVLSSVAIQAQLMWK